MQWPADIVSDLVNWTNTTGGITYSDLELPALVLQEYCFLFVCLRPAWNKPFTESDNPLTFSLSFWEASTFNLIVADILWIRSQMNSGALLTPSVFYHPGLLKTMANDASSRFFFSDRKFLSFFL